MPNQAKQAASGTHHGRMRSSFRVFKSAVLSFLKQVCWRFGALLLFTVPILAYGRVSDADLQKEYVGKVLTLRQFYPGGQLHFDATGKPASTVAPGPWTLDGQLR